MLDEQSGSLIFTSLGNINIKEFTQGPDGKFLLIATGSNMNASDVDAGSSISNPIPYLTVSNIGEGSVKGEHLILPIPGEDVMNASNSIGIPDMDSLVASMKVLPLPSVDSLPCNYDLLDSLNPPNASSNYMSGCCPPSVFIVDDILQEISDEARNKRIIEADRCEPSEKFNFSDFFGDDRDVDLTFRSFLSENNLNVNKRTSSMATSISLKCVALKKRPKMFSYVEEQTTNKEVDEALSHVLEMDLDEDCETSGGMNRGAILLTPGRETNYDPTWDDAEFDRELLMSTLKVENEYGEKLANSQQIMRGTQPFSVSEISPAKVISSFSSSLAEKDVFNDIVLRVPKTARSKM
jgi:hypothetical protein